MRYRKRICALALVLGPLIARSPAAETPTGATDQERTVNTATATQSEPVKATTLRAGKIVAAVHPYYKSAVPEGSCNGFTSGKVCWVEPSCAAPSPPALNMTDKRSLPGRGLVSKASPTKAKMPMPSGYETGGSHRRSKK